MPKGRYQRGTEGTAVPPRPPWPYPPPTLPHGAGAAPPPRPPGAGAAPPPVPHGAGAPPAAWPAAPSLSDPYAAPSLSDPYAAPPPSARVRTPVLAVFVVGIAAGVTLCLLVLFGLFQLLRYGMHSAEPPREPRQFDDPDVVAAVALACADLAKALEAIPAAGSAATAKGAWLRAENDAVDDFVAQVRRVGQRKLDADDPATTWLADWLRLRDARAAYADKLDRGVRLGFEPPRAAGGTPLVTRMDQVGNACAVPPRLYDLDSAVTPPTG